MREPNQPIRITLTVEVPPHTLGDMLLCDDPEGYPLATYGLAVREALARRVGWNEETEGRCKEFFKGIVGKEWKALWPQYVQAYAQSKLGIDFLALYCDRCHYAIPSGEVVWWKNPDGRRCVMHKHCYDEWQEQINELSRSKDES